MHILQLLIYNLIGITFFCIKALLNDLMPLTLFPLPFLYPAIQIFKQIIISRNLQSFYYFIRHEPFGIPDNTV